MVSGRAPFEAETPQALLAKHAADTVPSMRASDASIPLFVERAVERALAKSPSDRFQSATEFAEALTSEMVVARVGRRRWTRPPVSVPVIIVLLAAAVWGYVIFLGGPAYERLAVLPPVNLMNDPEQEPIIQGMLNGLISELGQAGVTIIGSAQSMMRYQDAGMTPREIAGELGVDAVIESTVLWVGDSVAVDVRLTDGRTEESLWSQSYVEDTRNVFGLYRQVTGAVADEIHSALTPQTEARLASAREVDPQAYEAYLKGQFYWQRGTRTDMDQAFEYFQQALLLDSTYAPAQAGIALVWTWRGQLWFTPQREAAAHGRAAILEALALDSSLAEVQYAVAKVRAYQEWDWEGGEVAFRKAIEINPNYVDARADYAGFLAIMERPEEARAQMDRALGLDPFNPMVRLNNAGVLTYEQRYAELIEEYEAILRIVPDQLLAYGNLADAYHMTGNYDEALAMLRRSFAGDQELDEALDRGYADGGYQAALRKYAETLATRPEAAGRLAWDITIAYARAGDKEQTMEWLERAYQAHDQNLMTASMPVFELVHDDPRYHDLRRRMGLPQ
jgi:TolB-like protein/tetratricopeptide (TPR) repeat protein